MRMGWARNIACMRILETHIQFWSENLNGTNHLIVLGLYGRMILKWIFKEIGHDAVLNQVTQNII
jgi:hypothetical protein